MVDNDVRKVSEFRFRCKICRQSLFWTSNLVTARGDSVVDCIVSSQSGLKYSGTDADSPGDPLPLYSGSCPVSHWFLDNNNPPEWTQPIINAKAWSSGKIHCPTCKKKLGAFDFITPILCPCGEHNIPPIRILKAKVDESSPSGSPIHRPNVSSREPFKPERKPLSSSTASIKQTTKQHSTSGVNSFPVEDHASPQDSANNSIAGAEINNLLPAASLPLMNDDTSAYDNNIIDEYVTNSREVEDLSAIDNGTVKTDNIAYEDIDTSLETTVNRFQELENGGGELIEPLDEDETSPLVDPEHYSCAVCLEVYYQPHACEPCDHIFCGPCLRRLNGAARASPKCPLCRKTIVKCHPNKELLEMIKYYFPDDFQHRRQIENSQRKKLPHLPGTGSLSSLFRQRRGRGREGSQILAASAGVCFVVCLIFLGFAVFATTVGFIMWFLLEVAIDAIPEIYFAMDNLSRFTFQALTLWCLDGKIPEGYTGAINASLVEIISSFSRMANRTLEFFNDDEVMSPMETTYDYFDQFTSLIPDNYGKHSYFTLLYYFLYSAVVCLIICTSYIIYRVIRYIFSLQQ